MTRAELLATLARRLNKYTTLDTATSTRLLEFLNEAHREILSKPGMRRLRDDSLTFPSVSGQAIYSLPWVAKVNRIFETTNDRLLAPITIDQYRRLEPDTAGVTGTPSCWVWLGIANAPSQILSTGAGVSLFAKSSDAADTTQTLYVEGEIVGGTPLASTVALNGTTAVQTVFGGTTWVRVVKCYLNTVAQGAVSLHIGSGSGTQVVYIPRGATSLHWYQLALYPTPSDVITYTADVTLGINNLLQDTDEPRLPVDFHDVLIYAAMMREYEKTEDQRYVIAERRYRERLGELQYFMAETASGTTALTSEVSTSRLGAWFPSGT